METTNQVALDDTVAWILHSKKMDYSYDIKVALPKSPPPEDGYPIVYVLDGNSYFQFARDVVRLQSRNTLKTFVNAAIIVGIGHSGKDEDVSKRRFFDFTAPSEKYIYPDRLKGFDVGEHGGAQKFLDFIQLELKPEIESRFLINKEKQTLFGHSLSGLFTLWALFKMPSAFQTYLASSPSIWWNDHEILTCMDQFFNQTKENKKRRLLMTVGELESFMVDDANQLFDHLKESQQEYIECALYIAPEENHASIVPTIMSRAIRFANQ